MNNRKPKTFLYVSLAFWALTVIGVIVDTVSKYYQIQAAFVNDPRRIREEIVWMIFSVIVFVVPVLMVALSGIRSTYKLLKHRPTGPIKICYLISAIISFAAFLWQALIFFRVTSFILQYLSINAQDLMLLLPGLPVLIVSFILGSIPIKHNEPYNTDKNIVK